MTVIIIIAFILVVVIAKFFIDRDKMLEKQVDNLGGMKTKYSYLIKELSQSSTPEFVEIKRDYIHFRFPGNPTTINYYILEHFDKVEIKWLAQFGRAENHELKWVFNQSQLQSSIVELIGKDLAKKFTEVFGKRDNISSKEEVITPINSNQRRKFLTEAEQEKYNHYSHQIEGLPEFNDEELEKYFKMLKEIEQSDYFDEIEDEEQLIKNAWDKLILEYELFEEAKHFTSYKVTKMIPKKFIDNLLYLRHIEYVNNPQLMRMLGLEDKFNNTNTPTITAKRINILPKYFSIYQIAAYPEVAMYFHENSNELSFVASLVQNNSTAYLDKKGNLNYKGFDILLKKYIEDNNISLPFKGECFT